MNNTTGKYLVGYMIRTEHGLQEFYSTFDTMEEAQESYDDSLLCDNLYSCNICKVIKSTDYQFSYLSE